MVRTRVQFPSTPLSKKCRKRLFYGTFSFIKGFKNAISDCFVPFEIEKIGEEIGEEKTQWHIVK